MSDPNSSGGVEPAPRRLDVLLCEPYFTGSHRAWATGLAAHSSHDVALVTHQGGCWKWRMQGAAPPSRQSGWERLAPRYDALLADVDRVASHEEDAAEPDRLRMR